VISADSILLIFSEALDSVSLLNPVSYSFDHGLTQPLYIGPLANDFRKVKLKLSSDLQVGLVYHCTVGNQVFDCAGNAIPANNTWPFALPEAASANDIVINEVLFNPRSGGYDFVELYNRSHKTIDLKNARIGSMDTVSGTLKSTKVITADGYLLFPGNYVVLTENSAAIKQQCLTPNPQGFLDVADLPAMNVDDGVVTVSDAAGLVIDNLIYTEKMHFPFIDRP
jgi:hypothetical protein